MFSALDPATWIRQSLVDYLHVHLHAGGKLLGRALQPMVREFTELAKGTDTKVVMDVYPRRMPPRMYREVAMSFYEAGADALAFWDSESRWARAGEWAFIKRLGHRDDLPRWQGKGDDYFRTVAIKRLDGVIMGREFSEPSDG